MLSNLLSHASVVEEMIVNVLSIKEFKQLNNQMYESVNMHIIYEERVTGHLPDSHLPDSHLPERSFARGVICPSKNKILYFIYLC